MSARKFGVRFLGVSAVLLASLQAEGVDKSMDKSGAFIGAEVGYAAGFTRVDPIPTNQQQQTTTQGQNITYPYAALGLKAGYGITSSLHLACVLMRAIIMGSMDQMGLAQR